MENKRAHDVIVEILQKSLTGQLNISATVNPSAIAEAIAARVEFEKSYSTAKNDKLVNRLREILSGLHEDAMHELERIPMDEKLLRNYVHGKMNTYIEILGIINVIS